MPQRTATIESMPASFRTMEAMHAEGVERRSEDYRSAADAALKDILEARMDDPMAGWFVLAPGFAQ